MRLRPRFLELWREPDVWRAAAQLESSPDLELARELLEAFEPPTAAQAETRDRIVAWIDAHPRDAHRRSCLAGHLTASALVVDAAGKRALLTHHRKLNRWLQLGGHTDGDANLVASALREALEESGIQDLLIHPVPIDVDIHAIPARKAEPEHLHLDTRFLVRAPAGAALVVSDESHDLAWLGPEQLARLKLDASVRRLFELVFG